MTESQFPEFYCYFWFRDNRNMRKVIRVRRKGVISAESTVFCCKRKTRTGERVTVMAAINVRNAQREELARMGVRNLADKESFHQLTSVLNSSFLRKSTISSKNFNSKLWRNIFTFTEVIFRHQINRFRAPKPASVPLTSAALNLGL